MLVKILEIIVIIIAIAWVSGVIYLISKGKIFKRFYHNIMEWHLPSDEPQELTDAAFVLIVSFVVKKLCKIVKVIGFKL